MSILVLFLATLFAFADSEEDLMQFKMQSARSLAQAYVDASTDTSPCDAYDVIGNVLSQYKAPSQCADATTMYFLLSGKNKIMRKVCEQSKYFLFSLRGDTSACGEINADQFRNGVANLYQALSGPEGEDVFLSHFETIGEKYSNQNESLCEIYIHLYLQANVRSNSFFARQRTTMLDLEGQICQSENSACVEEELTQLDHAESDPAPNSACNRNSGNRAPASNGGDSSENESLFFRVHQRLLFAQMALRI